MDLAHLLAGCVLALAVGCDTAEEKEPAEPDAAALHEAAAALGEACPGLGARMCKDTQLSCEETAALTGSLTFTPADCNELTEATKSVMTVGPDQKGRATVELMRIALQKATNVTETQRAGFDAWTRTAGKGPLELTADQLETVLVGVSCSGAGTEKSQKSDAGMERWCEVDGVRHGPAKLLNPQGQVVREARYVDGKLLQVEYVVPAKGSLSASAFVCPDGARRVEAKEDGGLVELSCVVEGNVTKVAVRRAGERIVEVVPTISGDDQFVGFMDQPEG